MKKKPKPGQIWKEGNNYYLITKLEKGDVIFVNIKTHSGEHVQDKSYFSLEHEWVSGE